MLLPYRETSEAPFFKKVLEFQRAYAALVVPSRLFMDPSDLIAAYYWGEKRQ